MFPSDLNLSDSEKAFMLVAILFTRKNLSNIVSYLPEESAKKILEASKKYLLLRQKDRVTQIIFDLKKLFSQANNFYLEFDKEKVKEKINSEPKYLQEVLLKILDNKYEPNKFFSEKLILQYLLESKA